ncbi:hypothetical protein QJQ45_025174, partial [Haematococcus lacustris]
MDPLWYARWDEGYQSAAAALHDRDEKVSAAALELEKELELVGLTAIEDRLQASRELKTSRVLGRRAQAKMEGVPEALQSLLAAGIKVWMITGDKRETAVNIAVSAALFSSADGLMTLAVDNSADAKVAILDLLNKTEAQRTANPAPDLGTQPPPPLPTGAPKAHTGQGGHARDLEGEGTRQSSFAHLLSPGRQKSHGQSRPAAGVGEGTQGGLLQGPLPPAGPGGPQHHHQTSQEEPGQQPDRVKARPQGPAQAQSKGSKTAQGAVSRGGDGLARGMELVIDGKALNHVLPDPGLRRSLALLCSRCSAVLVCRASPAQKATIVNMMRAYVLEQLLGPGSAADGAVGDPVVSAQPHEPSGCCANCLHTLHTALARGVAWCSRVMKSYTRGRQLLKAPIMLAIGDGANDVAMLQAADVGVGLMGREGRQAANSADYVLPNFRHLIPLLFVHGSLCRHRLARLASYSFYKNVAFWAVLFAFQPFCGWSGQAIVDDISAAVYNVVFTALPILMFSLLDRHAPDADLLATPRLYQARGAALASSEFWMSGVLLGLAHGVVSFFVPFLAITMDGVRPSNGMAVVGKAVYVALLGAVTLELAATTRHWTRLYAAILLLSYFLIFPFLAIFPYAERAVGYFDPTYLGVVPLPLFANPHFWLSIFAVYVATFGTRLVALGFNWLNNFMLSPHRDGRRCCHYNAASCHTGCRQCQGVGGRCCAEDLRLKRSSGRSKSKSKSMTPRAVQQRQQEPAAEARHQACPQWLPPALQTSLHQGVCTAAVPPARRASCIACTCCRLLVNATSSALTEAHLGNYYCLQPALIPEAYNKLHQAFYAPPTYGPMPEGGKQGGRAGGCLGLQREMAAVTLTGSAASSSPTLMYRQITHKLVTQARASKGKPSRFLLGGQPGSGKSCALVSLVERLRAESWLVLYVPSARALMRGGYFQQRLDPTGQPLGTWDTLTSAQHVLLGMQAAHALMLSRLPLRLQASRQLVESAGRQGREGGLAGAAVEVVQPERQQAQRPLPAAGKGAGTSQGQVGEADGGAGTAQITGPMVGSTANGLETPGKGGDSGSNKVAQPSLGSLVTVGLATDMDASLAVDCVLALTAEMCAQASPDLPVLLALDDYNALYGPSDYGTYDIPPPSHVRRREQLRQQGSAAFRPGTRRGPLAPDTLDADELDHREMAGDEHEEQQEPEVEEAVGEQVRQAAARRFVLQGEDLTLARGMRLLQSPLAATGNAMVVGATSWSAGVSPLLQIPCHPAEATSKLEVPRYSQA